MRNAAKTLTLTLRAEPDSVPQARHALREFAAEVGASADQLDAVRLASSEAVTNAVLHAYREQPGDVHVTAALVSDELWILVADDGCGLEPRTGRPGLGLGLGLISQVSDDLTIVPRSSGGTEVRMRFDLGNTSRARERASPGMRSRASGPRTRVARRRGSVA
jgi:anti-sigma regulatory factor (Ser/Thr protein kinase)